MAIRDDLSASGCGEEVEREPEVREVICLEESYNLKKIICGYVLDSVIRCFLHII